MKYTTFPRSSSRGGSIVTEKRPGANRGGGNTSDHTRENTQGSPSRTGKHKQRVFGNGHG